VPRSKKPPGQAIDKRNGQRAVLVPVGENAEPVLPPDMHLCDEAREQWRLYWASGAATVQTPADRGVVLRWVDSINRYLKLIGEADEEPTVTGSTGQTVLNPLYRAAEMALGTIERCEKQMGIGALNRAGLGIAVLTEQRTLADMNAAYGSSGDNGDSGPDPRLTDQP
jgi:P27 family predicted phage terminase small subunit